MDSIVIFDGTTHFVESAEYVIGYGEKIVFTGTFDDCCDKADKLNENL